MAENQIRPAVADAIEKSSNPLDEQYLSLAKNSRKAFVIGEALMDLIPVAGGKNSEMVGGGPCNSAKALARLGVSTTFIGGISSDSYGEAIERELLASGVNLDLVHRSEFPTALAIATINEAGLASYEFKLESTVSFNFHASWLPNVDAKVIHIGSVATFLEPGASELYKWLSNQSATVVFDPNVRPSIQGDKELYRAAIERWIGISAIVKLSEDDLNWLYGDEDAITEWLSMGPELVIVTRAEKGLTAYANGSVIEVPAVKVDVVDTVGAGDTIGAVIVEGVLNYGSHALRGELLREVLERAAKAAAITCSRAGANPPTREEIEKF
jgi:fructokinase